MNKVLLFFALTFAQLSMAQTSCIVTIPDANFKNALLNHTPVIDTNEDGEIQCDEATSFAGTITVNNESIEDLTGIEAFTSITSLNCNSNNLTSLNVSQNTALQQLYCTYNPLTNLVINTNTSLTYLQCSNTELTSLDISANTALEELYCGNARLTSLDASTNGALKYFQCSNNQLTNLNVANGNNTSLLALDAENNPNLTCIQVDNVSYSTTNWTNNSFYIPANASFSENCSLGLTELDKIHLSIYPNPTSGMIHLNETGNIQVLDMSGRLVLEENNVNIIDLNKQESGVYILKMKNQNGSGSARIIRE